MPPAWLTTPTAFVAGACLGSYAVTAAVRYARAEGSIQGRSHCDVCQMRLGFAETAPLISFVALKGRCRRCGSAIDPVHPVGELVGGVTLALVAIFGPTLENLLIAGLAFLLLASSVVDWRVQRLPDVVTVSIAAVGAVLAWLAGPEHVLMGLVGSALAFGLLVLLRKVRGRRGADPGLGMGDVKLISALALWLGAATPWMVVAAAVIGLAAMCLLRPRDGRLPFGPMIAISSLAVGVAMQSGLLPWPI